MNATEILILIPARFDSKRFPGKPLADLCGQTLLQRVWQIAQTAQSNIKNTHPSLKIQTYVATEDQRIVEHCQQHAMACLLTSDQCNSGTERAAEALIQLKSNADYVINLQGDNSLCPPWFVEEIISNILNTADSSQPSVTTPYVQLSWEALDSLRLEKQTTPFSGTCVIENHEHKALWFSKNIIPAIRKESSLRSQPLSPVKRHIGLYAYHRDILLNLKTLPHTPYEDLEGLEQLTFLEAGIPIHLVEVDYRGRTGMTGIDSPEDLARAQHIIETEGEITA